MECHAKTISTLKEWEKLIEDATESPLVLQVTASWCARCPAVHDAIKALQADFQFTSVESDASDTELTEYFEIVKLPALVIYNGMTDPLVHQAISVNAVNEAVKLHSKRRLITDADF